MKKSTLLRKTAYPASPQYADGFAPPAGYGHKMSVSLRNISIKVYGFDGTSWTMLHDTDGVIEDFIADVSYQKYYFESKTVAQQTVRVSFLSSEEVEDAHAFDFGSTSATRKLHHFDDVPVYRGSEQGKFLTVMSDGTLQWLSENESFTIPAEDDGKNNSIVWEGNFNLHGDASLHDDGAGGNLMKTNTTGYANSTWGQHLTDTNPDQMIASFWFKCLDVPSNNIRRDLFGARSGYQGVMAKLVGNGSSINLKSTYSSASNVNPPPSLNYNINLQSNVWYNVVMTLDKVAGVAKTYLNGAVVSEKTGITATANWIAGGPTGKFGLGSTGNANANAATGEAFEFDSFQMVEGYVLSDSEIATIYNDGSDREVVIPSAGQSAPSNSGLEEDSSLTLHGNAQLIDGVLTLDGTSGTYASLPHSTDYDRESGDLTVDFWFNANSLPSANNTYILMSKPTGAHNWNGWVIAYSTQRQDQANSGPLMVDGGIGVFASSQGIGGAPAQPNNFRATVAGGVAANTWHHVALTMPASGDYTIYLNGQSIGSWLPPYKNDSTDTELIFGATRGVGALVKFFPGELDQVSINKSILTASEIYDIHSTGR
jgi:hypothetical protein